MRGRRVVWTIWGGAGQDLESSVKERIEEIGGLYSRALKIIAVKEHKRRGQQVRKLRTSNLPYVGSFGAVTDKISASDSQIRSLFARDTSELIVTTQRPSQQSRISETQNNVESSREEHFSHVTRYHTRDLTHRME